MLKLTLTLSVIAAINALAGPPSNIPCSPKMCLCKKDGDYAYYNPDIAPPNDRIKSYYLTCIGGYAYCGFCWPLTLEYSESCKQCLLKNADPCCPTPPPKVDGMWGAWSNYSICNQTSGEGIQIRSRKCDNPKSSGGGTGCPGASQETKKYLGGFYDSTAAATSQRIVIQTIQTFAATSLKMNVTGKFQRAIFEIQKATAQIINLGDPTAGGKTLEKRYDDLKSILIKAANNGRFSFARFTLGKLLYILVKKETKVCSPIENIIEANIKLLMEIKNATGNLMKDIVASSGDATLIFTVDDTGSMGREIYAAKNIAKAIIDKFKGDQIDYILSPFNDPHTGPLIKKTAAERLRFVAAINALRARGGGDCPELAFKGMIDAIKIGPKFGSPMFVFTDSSAKDATAANMLTLKQLAADNAISITFFITGYLCGSGSYTPFKEIAATTAGQIFPLSDREITKFIAYVKSSLSIDTLISNRQGSEGVTEMFFVDSGLSKLAVTFSVTATNMTSWVSLESPSGATITSTATLAFIVIFEVENPAGGNWTLNFPRLVGTYRFSAQGVSRSPIQFAYNFQTKIGGTTYSVYNPIAGKTNSMVIRLAGSELLDIPTLRVDIVDEDGKVLTSGLSLTIAGSSFIFTTTFTPPTTASKLLLRGMAKDGSPFQRISREVLKAQSSFLQVAKAGIENTAKVGKNHVPITVQVLNTGESASFTFVISTNKGYVYPATITSTINNVGVINFSFNAPSGAGLAGTTATISVSAGGMSYSFDILLV